MAGKRPNLVEANKKTRFTSTNQPPREHKGRKPNRYAQLLSNIGYNESTENAKASNEDLRRLLCKILMATEEELALIQNNDKAPIVAKAFVSALREDIETGNIKAVEYLIEKTLGKDTQPIEMKGALEIEHAMTRKEYAELKNKLINGK